MYVVSGNVTLLIYHYFVFSATSQVILLIFHHVARHKCKIRPTEDQIEERSHKVQCVGMVDAVFWDGIMYDCDINQKALIKVQQLLRWTLSLDNAMGLRQLIHQ